MDGFIYRGKHISDFGNVFYIPNESERGEYAVPYKIEDQEINGRDGAYYTGNKATVRNFVLRCYYDGITQQTKEEMLMWFGRNTKGRLIFDDREYAYYDVIPNRRMEFEDYKTNGCNGLAYSGI